MILETERLILRPWEESDAKDLFQYWGQGLIPEAVREIMRHGFDDLNLEKLWCGYFDRNTKSQRVQEKCGFRYHHTKENVPCALEGVLLTEHITCLSKEEWISFK